MKIGIYYHIPFAFKDGKPYTYDFFGLFVQELSRRSVLCLGFFYEESYKEAFNFLLDEPNFRWINLGPKRSAWKRSLLPNSDLKKVRNKLANLDVLLVRSPTPLAPHLSKFNNIAKVVFFIVGDYEKGADLMKISGYRDWIIKYFLKWHNLRFKNSIKNQPIIVNSPDLEEKYKSKSSVVHLVKTTTLSKQDFFDRSDTCNDKTIKLLYTGRYDWAKGFKELIEALARLSKHGDYELHFAGWEDDITSPVEKGVKELAKKLKVDQWVFFHGKKRVGKELNQMYRMADIYVIPSYHEGFPRTIWEALANSLPVIATKVGAIPIYLEEKRDAILIDPKSSEAIVEGIRLIKSSPDLRKNLIVNGMEKAKENSLEIQTDKLISILSKYTFVRETT